MRRKIPFKSNRDHSNLLLPMCLDDSKTTCGDSVMNSIIICGKTFEECSLTTAQLLSHCCSVLANSSSELQYLANNTRTKDN